LFWTPLETVSSHASRSKVTTPTNGKT